MDTTSHNSRQEYGRLKQLIYKTPILQEQELVDAIEQYGRTPDNAKYYKKLKRKFWWHRKVHKVQLPLGVASKEWTEQQTPLVSVIVPNYCHAPYLKERIDCILNQTFRNFELILLDDCSKDNSREILLSYKDHPLVSHVVLNEQNTGNTFLQWEKGVALAKGKYIWIAESDDYADESFLDTMMAVFSIHPDCVMVRSGSYLTNQNGRILLKDWDVWKEDEAVHYYKGEDYIRHNMLHFNYVYNASMVVFRKDVFQKIDKSYQQLRYTGDWQCWIEFLEHGPICEYRRKLNYFRQHLNKVSARSNSTNKGIIDQVKVLAYTLDHFKLSAFRRIMVRGEQYRVAKGWFRGTETSEVKDECFQVLHDSLGVRKWHYWFYKVMSIFDFLSFVPSEKNDKSN